MSPGPTTDRRRAGRLARLDADLRPVQRRAGPRVRDALGAARSSAPRRRRSASPSGPPTTSGRRIFTIALTAVITIEPSKRRYDAGRAASACSSCSASPSAGPRPPPASAGRRPTRWCRRSRARPSSSSSSPAPTTSSSRRPSTSTGSPTAWRRCASTSTAPSSTRTTTGGCRSSRSRGTARRASSMPVEVWREAIDAVYPYRAWVPVDRDDPRAPAAAKAERGLPTFDAALDELLDEDEATDARAARAARLLAAATRATRSTRTRPGRPRTRPRPRSGSSTRRPTPRSSPTTFDHLRLECVLEAEPEAELRATVRFLQASGERHRAVERRLELGPAALAELGDGGVGREFELRGRADAPRPRCGCAPSALERAGPVAGPRLRPQHHRGRSRALERAEALRRQPALDPRRRRGRRRALRLAARARRAPPATAVAGCRRASTPSRCSPSPGDDAILGGDDRAPRPSADRAREPRQPVRQHRDRGGAAAARPGALRRRARRRSPTRTPRCGDDRARRARRRPSRCSPCTA